MKATKQFIEDVKSANPLHFDKLGRTIEYHLVSPESWQAVFSKEEKCWACKGEKYFEDFFTKKIDLERPCGNCKSTGVQMSGYKEQWHTFIDHRVDGKTIEESLKAISK